MVVYSYYYGASAGKGIGVQAQSKELERLPLSADLKALSSLHALESSERNNEMLSYLLTRGEHLILGLSYLESPKNSGYNRSAPCGLQYVVPGNAASEVGANLGRIINFINFRKPETAAPAPMRAFPLNESGYYYHNSASVMAPLVDQLVKVALSSKRDVLLVALPRGKNSEYATARYTIAEALGYLPVSLRQKIRFFTGLPVEEGVSDPLAGFEKAIQFDANVVFCPNEYYRQLKNYRTCLGLDMDNPVPEAPIGEFASFITSAPDVSTGLLQVDTCLEGRLSYESLNRAAQRARRGEAMTIDKMNASLQESRQRYRTLEQQSQDHYDQYLAQIEGMQRKIDNQNKQISNYRQRVEELEGAEYGRGRDGGRAADLLAVLKVLGCALLLMLLTAAATWLASNYSHTGDFLPVYQGRTGQVVKTAAGNREIPNTDLSGGVPGEDGSDIANILQENTAPEDAAEPAAPGTEEPTDPAGNETEPTETPDPGEAEAGPGDTADDGQPEEGLPADGAEGEAAGGEPSADP